MNTLHKFTVDIQIDRIKITSREYTCTYIGYSLDKANKMFQREWKFATFKPEKKFNLYFPTNN